MRSCTSEDLIMPILRALPKSPTLNIECPELEGVFGLIISGPEGKKITPNSIKNLYRQLDAHAEGSPVAWRYDTSPEDVAFALIILREVMHHGSFRYVYL